MGESYTYSFSPVGAGVFLFNFGLFPCVFGLIPYGKQLKSDGKESKSDRKLPKLDGKGLRFRVFGFWILDLRSGFRSSSLLLFSHSVGFLVISSGVRFPASWIARVTLVKRRMMKPAIKKKIRAR